MVAICRGWITACDLPRLVDSPSVDVSLKDGYEIHSGDIAAACEGSPGTLHVMGLVGKFLHQ